MRAVDRELIERFVIMAGESLSGSWVVMGGGVLPLLGVEHRVTVDLDVAGPESAGNEQTIALMDIAERLGLPVEAINQAGAFFLRRIEGWRDEVVVVHEGPRATIHRPSVTLFILLKIPRLSESDLADCIALLGWASRHGEEPDARRLLDAVEGAIAGCSSGPRLSRLEELREALHA